MSTETTEGIDPEFQGWFAEPPAPDLPPFEPFEERELPYATGADSDFATDPAPEPVAETAPDGELAVVTDPEPVADPAPEPRSKVRFWRGRTKSESTGSEGDLEPESEPTPKRSPYAVSYGEPTVKTAARGDSGRWLDTHLLTVLAGAAALPALRVPAAWVIVCSIAAFAMLAVASVRGQAKEKGSADVVVVPARVVGKMLLGAINPLNWLKVLLGALASLTAGGVVAAVIAAAKWIVTEGSDGILAAIRQGVWAHAPTYGAAFACFILLRGIGQTHERRAVSLYKATRKLPEYTIAAIAVFVAVAGVSLALAGPSGDVGFVRGSDGLGWVPPGLRTAVDGLRDDAVAEELDSATACLNKGQGQLWTSWYTADNALGEVDVATFSADATRPPDQVALAGVALVAHNHLAPWVEMINVGVGDQVLLTIDRRGLARDEPVTDSAVLRANSTGAPEWLTTVAPTVNTAAVLTCSARTPF